MFFLLVMIAEGSLDLKFPFNCSDLICPSYYIGDYTCEASCMTPPCNFDSTDTISSS